MGISDACSGGRTTLKSGLLVGFLLVAGAASAGPESPKAVAGRFVAEFRKATQGKDAAFIDNRATPDFVYVGGNGEKYRKGSATELKKAVDAQMTVKSVSMRLVSARHAKGGVLLVMTTKLDAKMKPGSPFRVETRTREEYLLVRQEGRWLVKRGRKLWPRSSFYSP